MTSTALATARPAHAQRSRPGSFIAADDGTALFYRDWGTGAPVVFCHPWSLNADIWEYQMTALSAQGLRCVAFDRRGHGRSEDPGYGYDFETLAADLAAVIEQRDLRDVTLVGYSMGSAEVIHYVSRYGTDRVARVLLTSPIPPAGGNPDLINGFVAALRDDRPALIANGLPLFTGREEFVSPAMAQWLMNLFLSASPKAIAEFQHAIAREDHLGRLKDITVPTLIVQGDADEVSALDQSGRVLAAAIPDAKLCIYEGAPHGIVLTHRNPFTKDLLHFIRG